LSITGKYHRNIHHFIFLPDKENTYETTIPSDLFPGYFELKAAVDSVLSEIRADGTYDVMMNRWFPDKGDPAPMPEIKFGNIIL
jgi:ABC-type amino acid transport substrate-binding protein